MTSRFNQLVTAFFYFFNESPTADEVVNIPDGYGALEFYSFVPKGDIVYTDTQTWQEETNLFQRIRTMADLYAKDGVDVAEGDSISEFASRICRESYGNSPFVKVHDLARGHFRGPRGISLDDLVGRLPKGCFLDAAPDGIGTKVVVIDSAYSYGQAARDLLAMCNGDISRWGGMPLFFANVLAASTLGKHDAEPSTREKQVNNAFRALLYGLGEAAKEQGVVIYKGETAEVGACVGSDNPNALIKFNWEGMAMGVYDPARLINGNTLAVGQIVMALREKGFRSNGISMVRKALAIRFGPSWFSNPEAFEAISAAVEASVLYDRFLCDVNGWFGDERITMHLIAHITGGGIKSKFAEDILFPLGLSAELDDLWEPPLIMKQCVEWRNTDPTLKPEERLTDKGIHATWNGGQGVLTVIDEKDESEYIDRAARHGIGAKRCGKIMQSPRPYVRIKSKFSGEWFEYPAA